MSVEPALAENEHARLCVEQTNHPHRAIRLRIDNRGPQRLAVLHPESPRSVRAYFRVEGAVLVIAKAVADVPAGIHVSAVPAPFVAILEPGGQLEERLILGEDPIPEFDPMRVLTIFRDHAGEPPSLRQWRRRSVKAVSVVVQVAPIATEREIRGGPNAALLFPGLVRDELTLLSAHVPLETAAAVEVYSWEPQASG